jgi:hypothetical protein
VIILYGGVNDICPVGFSVPTQAELAADTTGINNDTAFSGFLRLPNAGFRDNKPIVISTPLIVMSISGTVIRFSGYLCCTEISIKPHSACLVVSLLIPRMLLSRVIGQMQIQMVVRE